MRIHQSASAQACPPEVEAMGYARRILLNGKIVSMDDATTSTSPGKTTGVAVKGDKIVKLGTTDEIRAFAGREHEGRTTSRAARHRRASSNRTSTSTAAPRAIAERFGLKCPPNGIQVDA